MKKIIKYDTIKMYNIENICEEKIMLSIELECVARIHTHTQVISRNRLDMIFHAQKIYNNMKLVM